uniref:Isoform 3 of Immediate-early protein 2 n=1 Tax=Human herpesvirus 6A (strain Uganda-1102) TaxID=10370 RepID=Q77Z83-2
MEPAKPSGNNMGSNDERMQDYRPDPMMEESIKEILEESLMCDTSFDDLIIPGLESFGLIIPESSNNIESNNVEEGSDGELKTLAEQKCKQGNDNDVIQSAMKLSGLYCDADITHTQPLSDNTHQDPIYSQESRIFTKTIQDPRIVAQTHRQCTSSASNLQSNESGSTQVRFASELPNQLLQPMYTSHNQNANLQNNFTSLPYQPYHDPYRDIESSYRESRNTNRGYDYNFRHHPYRPRGGNGKYNYYNPNSKYQQPYKRCFTRTYNRRGRGHRSYDCSDRSADLPYEHYTYPNYEQQNPDPRMNNYKDFTQLTNKFNFESYDYSMAFSTDSTHVQSDNYNHPTKAQTIPETTKTKKHEATKDNETSTENQVLTPDVISLSYRPSSYKMDIIKKIYDTDVIPLPKEALTANGSNRDVDIQKYKKAHIRCRSVQKKKERSSQTNKHDENHASSRSDLKERKSNENEDKAVTKARDFSKLNPLLSPLPLTPEPAIDFADHTDKFYSTPEFNQIQQNLHRSKTSLQDTVPISKHTPRAPTKDNSYKKHHDSKDNYPKMKHSPGRTTSKKNTTNSNGHQNFKEVSVKNVSGKATSTSPKSKTHHYSSSSDEEGQYKSPDDLCYRDYVRLKERKVSEKFKIHRGRVATKDFQKLFRNTMRAFEYKQIPKKPCNEKNLKEAVYDICCNGLSNNAAIIMYFTRSKKVAQIIKIMQKELMIRPNITVSEAFKMNHAPPKYYDKDEIKRFIQLQKQGPQELWDKFENNTTHDLFTRHSDVKTMIIYAATPIDFVGAVKTCNKYAKDNPKEIVLRVCSIIDGDNPISIYNPISKEFKSKFSTLSKC